MGFNPFSAIGSLAGNVVGGLAGGISGAAGLGNDFQATPYYVDQSSFTGQNVLLPAAYGFYDQARQAQANSRAPQIAGAGPVAYDAAGANAARADQQQLNTMLWNRANGVGPSAALENARVQADAARRGLASIGASASSRGGISAAQAARLATTGGVDASQRIAADAGVQRQQEMIAAGGMLGQNLAQTRGQDLASAQAQAGVGLQNNAQQIGVQSTNAQLAMQQQQITNQLVQYYTSLGFNAQSAYVMANQAYQQLQSQNYNNAQAINSGVAAGNAQTQANVVGGLLSAGGQVGAMAMGKPPSPAPAQAPSYSGTLNPF